MIAAHQYVFAIAVSAAILLGQPKPNHSPALVTLCEVLANVDQYANTDVAIVGRLERSVSLVEQSAFLSQDSCKHPLVRHGHSFPNRIQILTYWETGMPKPPDANPRFGRTRIAAKFSEVRKATKPGSHEEPQFDTKGNLHTIAVPNEWAIVYGRVAKIPGLDEDCGADGCGGDDVPLVIIAKDEQVHKLASASRK